MKAFLGKKSVKTKYLNRLKGHRQLDHLVQGIGWETNGVTKGCAVGCCVEAYDHSRYPIELGIPEEIAYLEDAIFEGLPQSEALLWPEAFLNAIPVGADLSMVWPRFALCLLTDQKHGVRQYASDRKVVAEVIDSVAVLYQRWIKTDDKPSKKEFDEAAEAAWAAWAARKTDFWRAASKQLIKLLKEAKA